MKNIKLLSVFVFALTLITFTSCEKVGDLADVTFDAKLSSDISVESSGETLKGKGFEFNGSDIIDPASDSEINKYWDLIKEWDINKVTISVKEISEDAHLDYGALTLKDNETENVLFDTEVNNFDLKNGTVIMDISDGDWSKLINSLNKKHKIFAEISGSIDKPSVEIVFKIDIFTSITANPL